MVIGHLFLVPTMAAYDRGLDIIYPNTVHQTIDDVFNFKKIAAVFLDVVSNKHAASQWGQQLEPEILSMITVFAAPCILSAGTYMARHKPDVDMDELLVCFKADLRRYQWWWGNTEDKDALVDMVALDSGPRIFAGALATWDFEVEENQQSSAVFKRDEDGNATWYVFVMELRGSHSVHIDLMVHADSTMQEILLFACNLFHMPLIPSTVLILWGVDEEGGVDVEDPSACLGLSTDSTSPVLHRSFAEVYAIMQQAAAMMEENLLAEETDTFDHHYEWRNIVNMQVSLWD